MEIKFSETVSKTTERTQIIIRHKRDMWTIAVLFVPVFPHSLHLKKYKNDLAMCSYAIVRVHPLLIRSVNNTHNYKTLRGISPVHFIFKQCICMCSNVKSTTKWNTKQQTTSLEQSCFVHVQVWICRWRKQGRFFSSLWELLATVPSPT